jgi:hypothetical protein
MTIELSPHLETALENEAARRGTTPQSLAVQFIAAQLPNTASPNGALSDEDLIERWKEHFRAVEIASREAKGPTNLSQDTGRRFAELLQEQRRQGRL